MLDRFLVENSYSLRAQLFRYFFYSRSASRYKQNFFIQQNCRSAFNEVINWALSQLTSTENFIIGTLDILIHFPGGLAITTALDGLNNNKVEASGLIRNILLDFMASFLFPFGSLKNNSSLIKDFDKSISLVACDTKTKFFETKMGKNFDIYVFL